ncbi:MAG: LytR C-terminal domain-containing protein [Chlorobiota bacterium]
MAHRRWWYNLATLLLGGFVALGSVSLVHRWTLAAGPLSLRTEERLLPGETLQVRILNACGYPKAARRMMEYLRRSGIDVVEIANAEVVMAHSAVWDHVGSQRLARYVARLAGLPEAAVLSCPDSNLYVHCSLVLGLDILQTMPFASR